MEFLRSFLRRHFAWETSGGGVRCPLSPQPTQRHVYMLKKNPPGKEGHLPSQINFTENWYERKFETSSPAKNWEWLSSMLTLSRLDQVDPGEPLSADMDKKWL